MSEPRVYTLRCEMLSGRPIRKTFAVFEDPYNLAKITPPWLNFRVTSAARVQMRNGEQIDYLIRWLGLPIRWRTLITEYEPPFVFVDEQKRGPYTLWRHHHTFEETPEGTKVCDQVEYALPFGPIGRLIHGLIIRRQLLGIFRFRQRELAKIFGAGARQVMPPCMTRDFGVAKSGT